MASEVPGRWSSLSSFRRRLHRYLGHTRHTPEFRFRMVKLMRAGRYPVDLAREFESTA